MENDKVHTHESYGALEISRSNCPSTALFGSSILHDNVIKLRVTTAKLRRGIHRDFIHQSYSPKDTYVEVEMSYTQFAEAIISLNNGAIPVTVRMANGRRMEPCPFTSKEEQFRTEFLDDMKNLSEKVDYANKRAKTLLESKKPLTKAEKEELLSVLGNLSTEINANIPFIRDSFAKQMEKSVTEAKCNIEGFIQTRMDSLAKTAIAENISKSGSMALLPANDDVLSANEADGEFTSVISAIRQDKAKNNDKPRRANDSKSNHNQTDLS